MSKAKKKRFPFFSFFGSKSKLERSKRSSSQRRLMVESMEERRLMALDVVADLNTVPNSSDPAEFVQAGNTLYFVATGRNGRELHYSSVNGLGVVSSTVNHFDLNPGNAGSNPQELTVMGSSVYFTADTPSSIVTGGGREIWVATGSEVKPLKDIYPGGIGSTPKNLTVVGNRLYFTADALGKGRELWKTDGTALGTDIVRDIYTTPNKSSDPQDLVAFKGKLYFSADDGLRGRELWQSDGTPRGTRIVREIYSGLTSSNPTELTVAGDRLFFAATTPMSGREIWVSDGTPGGTKILSNINTHGLGSNSSNPTELTAVGNDLYFTASTPETGRELYLYHHFSKTVSLVRDIAPGNQSSSPTELTAVGSTLYFVAHGGEHSSSPRTPRVLWKSFGADILTIPVQGWHASDWPDWIKSPSDLTAVGDTLYFGGTTSTSSKKLYQTKGTTADTKAVSANPRSVPLSPSNLTAVNGRLHLAANDGYRGTEHWVVDASGAALKHDVFVGNGDSKILNQIVLGNEVYFVTQRSNGKLSLHRHNPSTSTFTTIVTDSLGSSNIQTAGGNLFYSERTENSELTLWKTNAASNSNTLLKTFTSASPLIDISPVVDQMTTVGNSVYFIINESYLDDSNSVIFNSQIWKSNGTVAGTVRLLPDTEFLSSAAPTNVTRFTAIGNRLYFVVWTDTEGYRLWKSDGTDASTIPVSGSLTEIHNLVQKGNELYFYGHFAVAPGSGLYRTNGTANGTQLVKNLTIDSSVRIINVDGTLYFAASEGSSDVELFKSDGTTEGTKRVKDIFTTGSSFPKNLTNVNGKLFFTVVTSAGRELWTSDGTDGPGTYMVKDIAGGAFSSSPSNLANAAGTLYFNALTLGSNNEPLQRVMMSDGTPGGTKPIPVSTVKYSGTPANLITIGNAVYFTATAEKGSQNLGNELLIYKPDLQIRSFTDTVSYVAGGPNFLIDTDATITASSFTSFDGGSLTFRTAMNTQPEDRFTIRNQGTGAGQIGAVGAEVSYGGVVIGTRNVGTGTSPLIITFNANATTAAIQALIRNILWRSASSSTLIRTLSVSLSDGLGNTSLALNKKVIVSSP